jgi:hypothetical protein
MELNDFYKFMNRPEIPIQIEHWTDNLKKSFTPTESVLFLMTLICYVTVLTSEKNRKEQSLEGIKELFDIFIKHAKLAGIR